MFEMNSPGKLLIILGATLIFFGLLFSYAGKIPWIGRLPGDIYIHKKNFTLFFPITTAILISVIISVLLILFRRR